MKTHPRDVAPTMGEVRQVATGKGIVVLSTAACMFAASCSHGAAANTDERCLQRSRSYQGWHNEIVAEGPAVTLVDRATRLAPISASPHPTQDIDAEDAPVIELRGNQTFFNGESVNETTQKAVLSVMATVKSHAEKVARFSRAKAQIYVILAIDKDTPWANARDAILAVSSDAGIRLGLLFSSDHLSSVEPPIEEADSDEAIVAFAPAKHRKRYLSQMKNSALALCRLSPTDTSPAAEPSADASTRRACSCDLETSKRYSWLLYRRHVGRGQRLAWMVSAELPDIDPHLPWITASRHLQALIAFGDSTSVKWKEQ